MSGGQAPEHDDASKGTGPFRFTAFADAPSAQAAFEAAYPLGSPIEPSLQALVDMGAQCKSVGLKKFACRYVENESALGGFCWHVALEADSKKVIQRVVVTPSMLGA